MGMRPQQLPAWEEEARAALVPLTLKTRWVGERGGKAAQLELTVTNDETNATLLKLYGGFVINKDQHVLPTETIIVAATGERYRGICKFKSPRHMELGLQTSVPPPARAPATWNARSACRPSTSPSSGPRTRTLAAAGTSSAAAASCAAYRREETSGCPLCRAPIAEEMTALKARRLPIDTNAAAEMEADAVTAFECKPMSINTLSDPPSYWVAPSTSIDDTTVPTVIAIRPPSGGIVRAWRDAPPKPNATEAEQRTLLGVVHQADERRAAGQAHRRAADGTRCGGGLLGERVQGGPGRLPGGAHRDVLGAREGQSVPAALGRHVVRQDNLILGG